jgi:hypothetical protein
VEQYKSPESDVGGGERIGEGGGGEGDAETGGGGGEGRGESADGEGGGSGRRSSMQTLLVSIRQRFSAGS